MPGVEPTSRVTSFSLESVNDLSRQLDKLYEKLANGINTKTDTVVNDDTAPSSTIDVEFEIGTMWVKRDTNQVYVLTDLAMVGSPSVLTADWTEVS